MKIKTSNRIEIKSNMILCNKIYYSRVSEHAADDEQRGKSNTHRSQKGSAPNRKRPQAVLLANASR